MEFRLVYQGPLPAASPNSTRIKEKHTIRRILHKQLKNLWKVHPFIAAYARHYEAGRRRTATSHIQLPDGHYEHIEIPYYSRVVDELSAKYERCGYRFVPLIGGIFGAGSETVCALDIQFLRREAAGSVISGGDIDNRLKVLFDALRMPKDCQEVKGFVPDINERPFFCLLEDDSLITEVRVTTDQLHTPLSDGERIHDVNLIIHVKTMAVGMGFADIGMPAILDTQLRLSNADAAHESQLLQLHDDGDAIRADVNQEKEAIQALIADNAALRADLAVIIAGDVKIARATLALDNTLRNRVLLLVAELREIGSRIKIIGDRPVEPTAPPGRRVSSWTMIEYTRAVQNFEGRQTWKQYWDIYRSDFDERVKAIVKDLQQAKVASEILTAFPEHVSSYDELEERELRHDLPFSVNDQLIPELLRAADALTRSPSS